MDDANNIKYFAQELKKNTYNLTRMNLVMRGILPNNIHTRNGDTLEEDWPYFDESDPVGTYDPLYIDAVVSNPPYSQKWDSTDKESDPRYARFGLAPKTKADYAFLLHDLYHLKPDGIMTIVLPHGVLFRGGEEGQIRKNLIEQNHIDTIISLPANIFFGTGIPTVILVLKQQRDNSDILIIDASKGFEKVGKNNKLRASDIKKIADTVIERKTIAKYSKVVSREAIRENEYNLNIPRYVDSSAEAESFDIYATMFGGMPKYEIERLDEYWQAFPTLKMALFEDVSGAYTQLKTDNIKETITEHSDVLTFIEKFDTSFGDFNSFLKRELLEKIESLHIQKEETLLSDDIFKRLEDIALIDKYEAYQLLNDNWLNIAVDLEIIQTEGFNATKQVNPNMVLKKKDGKEQEVQDGWIGHVMPFELLQITYLKDELEALLTKEQKLVEITAKYEEIIDSLSEEEKDTSILNDKNDTFVKKEITNALKEIYADIESEEISLLKKYMKLLENKAKKPEKIEFIQNHKEVSWSKVIANKDATFGKKNVESYMKELQAQFTFEEDTYESKIVLIDSLLTDEAELKKEVKAQAIAFHLLTKETIETLNDAQVYELLELKWIEPLLRELNKLPEVVIDNLTNTLQSLEQKYETTLVNVEDEIKQTQKELSLIIDELDGGEFDMQGLKAFQDLLEDEVNDE